jgi:DNA polymerase-3 subunit alpha
MAPVVQSTVPTEGPLRMVLLAESESGYRNLVTLVNMAYRAQRRDTPRIDLEMLEKHAGGLIALTGSAGSELHHLLSNNRVDETEHYISRLARIMGRDNLIFQLEDIDSARQRQINDRVFALSDFLNIRCVATNGVCFLRPEDSIARDFLLRGRFPSFLQFQVAKESAHSRHLASGMQMRDRFLKYSRALYATEEVAERCLFQPNYEKRRFPVHDFQRGFDADSFLWDLTFREARARFVELTQEMKNRLNDEFDYIKTHGLSNNILLLWNIAQFARKNRINVGVGRGDMITSLVAYILGITRINPLDYKMRFLGIGRDKNGDLKLSVEIPSIHIEALDLFIG